MEVGQIDFRELVKPLEWAKTSHNHLSRVETCGGYVVEFVVEIHAEGFIAHYGDGVSEFTDLGDFTDLDTAKQACQTVHETEVLKLLRNGDTNQKSNP